MAKRMFSLVCVLALPGCAALSLFGQTHSHTHHHYHNCSGEEIEKRVSSTDGSGIRPVAEQAAFSSTRTNH